MARLIQSTLAILIAISFCLVFSWFSLRSSGLATPHVPLKHPFFANEKPGNHLLIAYRGASLSAPENTIPAFELAAQVNPNVILWADVQLSKDGVPVVFSDTELHESGIRTGSVRNTDFADMEKIDPGELFKNIPGAATYQGKGVKVPTLPELIEKFPQRRFVLNFPQYQPGQDVTIGRVLRGLNIGDRIILQSPVDGFLKDMREIEALWLFGTSQAQITQFLLWAGVGLESAAKIRGDVYISPLLQGKRHLLNIDLVSEIHRRQMRAFAGPADNDADVHQLLEMGVDGIITRDPVKFAPLVYK